jgi:hypothetical protein
MSWDYIDDQQAQEEEYLEKFLQESLKSISVESAKSYLGTYGDAVDTRVMGSLHEAEELLNLGYLGPALCLAAMAIELMIRFLLLRPLVQGALLSDEWAAILVRRVTSGRSSDDRKLLPAVLRQWGIDITTVQTESGIVLWEYVLTELWPTRNKVVHSADRPERETVASAIECARHFRKEIVGSLASKLGFTLETTGKWSEIRWTTGYGSSVQTFEPQDPFTGTGEGP